MQYWLTTVRFTARFRNATAYTPTLQRSKTVVSNWQRYSRSGFFVSTNIFPVIDGIELTIKEVV